MTRSVCYSSLETPVSVSVLAGCSVRGVFSIRSISDMSMRIISFISPRQATTLERSAGSYRIGSFMRLEVWRWCLLLAMVDQPPEVHFRYYMCPAGNVFRRYSETCSDSLLMMDSVSSAKRGIVSHVSAKGGFRFSLRALPRENQFSALPA